MGNAYVGIADDVNAVYFNPAGLGFISRPELTAMHTNYFQDMNYEFGAFAYPTDYGAFAISAATLKVEEIQKRASNETLQGTFDASDSAYGFSYSRLFGPLLALGVTARYIEQEIDTSKAGTWSGDLGVMKKFGRIPMSLGLAVRHFGEDIEFTSDADPLPTTVDLGVGFNLMKDRVQLGLNVQKPRDNDYQFGTGLEVRQPLGKDVRAALRGGYNSAWTDADSANGFAMGGGLAIHSFDVDFAWVPFGDLGDTIRYSLRFRF
jgi:hypothetical protein